MDHNWKCKYCDNESFTYEGFCDDHFMLGAYFQYECCGTLWNFNEGNNGMMRKYEAWIKTLSPETIKSIRENYWLK